jgi:hypothetical protein
VKPLRYIWAFPTTALGLLPAAAALLTGGQWRIVDGVLEVHGGLLDWLLRACVPIRGGAQAMTLGHVIIGRNERSLDVTRRHERAHVRQCEQWGPAFVPAYLASSFVLMLRGKNAYWDNHFEREARASEERAAV